MVNRSVDVFMASLPRQLDVVETVKSLLKNAETLSITITCSKKYSDLEFNELQKRLFEANNEYQTPIYLHRSSELEKGSNEKLKYIDTGLGKYIALCDDDCIYPPDYFQTLIKGCEEYQAHVSLHGVLLFPRPIKSYYRDRRVFRGLDTVDQDYQVDIASSCMTLWKREWHTNYSEWYDSVGTTSMDDLYVSAYSKHAGIKRFVLKHQEGYVKHKVQYEDDQYVYDKYAKTIGADHVQTDFVNKYF